MTFRSCPYEGELTQALKDGHWPDGCERRLRDHVASCRSCGDLVLVTRTLQAARSESIVETPSGSPGLLWWRAQLRRRNRAAETVSRPVTVAQIFAWCVNLLVAAAFLASQYDHGLHWSLWWSGMMPARVVRMWSAGIADWNLALFIPGFGLLILLSGIVVYLASEKQ